ncbi:FHA domain-containing protein [Antrihabitans stalactiti]|uniref:FHA domain-containing protein n=1 Tax=Antrihabitans stalactiti TaxID=2584121 RepID=A0A848KRY5_9NOCA|nr:FHA domain-containing protein [Antrihabitans stalactiti]NMN99040.1 FHA domain-containing protein [Antrihabitans stalactiti]
MTHAVGGEGAAENTSMFRADDFGADPTPNPLGVPEEVGVEGLPPRFGLIVVRRGPNAGARFLLDHAISSAGRHPDADVFLDDVTVSRRHAEFRHDGERFVLVDVGSLNGTYLNHVLIDSAVLADRDEIQIGKYRLQFHGLS